MPATHLADCDFATRVAAASFDEASEQLAPLMRVRYVQLERGAARVDGAIARLPRVLIGRFGGNRNKIVRLEVPHDRLMLFVPVRGLARIGTMSIGPQQAVLVGAAAEVVAFTDRSFLPVVIALNVRDLAEAADELKGDVRCVRIGQERMLGLDHAIQAMLQAALTSPRLCAPDSLAALDDELVSWGAALLANADASSRTLEGAAARRRAALRARDFIDAHLDQRLSLSQVCRASYTSARALAYGFREMFGLSPMAYVRCARMAHVRSELYLMPPQRRAVSALAHKWGFWHLSQFAKDYRALFGELPSTTLGRGAADAHP
jgi:AraC-like DNA-binding protein